MSTQEITQPVVESKPAKLIVQDNSAISYLMDTGKFEHCYRIAKLMATASLIPDHLRLDMKTKQPLPAEQVAGNCFMIVNQSLRWGFDPFAVAPETYVVSGKLAYQGKLVAAAVNALGGLKGDLDYEYSGKIGTDDFTVTVSGQKLGEDKPRTVTVSVGQAKTANEMWRKDPEQKLSYTGAIKWARRHTPGVIMGILIQEDLEEIEMRQASGHVVDSTPPKVISGEGTPAPATTAKASPAPEQPKAPPTVDMPERASMIADLRTCYRAAGIKTGLEAEAVIRAAGMLPIGAGLSGQTTEAIFEIWSKRDQLFVAFPEAPEAKAEGTQTA